MLEKIIRFGISDNLGHKGETWRLWSPTGKDDIYLACRALGGSLKASMHESGAYHIAYTKQAYVELIEGLVPTEKNRFIDKWVQPKPISPGVTLTFRIVTPYSAVTLKITNDDGNVTWIKNCEAPNAIEIDIFIISSGTLVTGWLGKNSKSTKLIGNFQLENGNSVYAVYWTIPMPDLSSFSTGAGKFFKGRGQKDLETGDLRAIAFGTEPDGSRTIFNCAVIRKGV